MPTSTRPSGVFTAEQEELLDWLAANGIDEYVPEDTTFDIVDGQISYTSFVWSEGHERGWDRHIKVTTDDDPTAEHDTVYETRTVPLREPVTDRIRNLFAAEPHMNLAE